MILRSATPPDLDGALIARALVREGEARAGMRGARRFSALVLAAEAQAVGLWEGTGYDRDPRVVRFTKTL